MDDSEDEERLSRELPKESLLSGHAKSKKKLIPPLKSIPRTNFVSTIDTIVPEIIWAGIILDYYGNRQGIEAVREFLVALWSKDPEKNWYRFSDLARHPDFVESVTNAEVLGKVEIAFLTIRNVYSWVGLDWVKNDEATEISRDRLVRAVSKYSDRHEQPYLIALSAIVYSMGIAGKMVFSKTTVPDFEAIVNDWGSDEADLAATTLRALSMAFFPSDNSQLSESWCKAFWRTNYKISECR